MEKLTGKTRFSFFYNQGIHYALAGGWKFSIYREVDAAYNHFKTFKPFRPLEIGTETGDFKAFELGYVFGQNQIVRMQKMKARAVATCKNIMAAYENAQPKHCGHTLESREQKEKGEGYFAESA